MSEHLSYQANPGGRGTVPVLFFKTERGPPRPAPGPLPGSEAGRRRPCYA
jgi:hypothetical protein